MYKSLIALGMAIPCLGFSQQFQQVFGGDGFDIVSEIIQLEDQSYVAFGVTTSFGSETNGIINHLDAFGNLISTHSLTLMNGTELYDIELNDAGNVFFVGACTSDAAGNAECLFGECSLTGEIIWSKGIPAPGVDVAYGLTLSQQGGFTFVASTNSFSPTDDFNPIVVQVDASGNTIWSTSIDIEGYARPNAVTKHPDGGLLVFGHHLSDSSEGNDLMLIKMSSTGEVQWIKDFKAPGNDLGWRIMATENGFILGGDTDSFGEGLNDVYLIHIDLDGNVLSQRTYGGAGNDHLSSITPGKGDKLMIGGTTSSFGGGQLDVLAMELESDGSVSWSKAYGGAEKEVGLSVLATPDGGYIFGGYSRSFAENFYYDAYLVKTNDRGDCYCNSVWDELLTQSPCQFSPGSLEWGQGSISDAETWEVQSTLADLPILQTLCTFGDLVDGPVNGEESSIEITLGLENISGEIVSLVPILLDGSLQVEVVQHRPANLSVYTITGRMVQNVPVSGIGRQTISVKVKGMSPGIYLVSLVDGYSTHTKKVYVN